MTTTPYPVSGTISDTDNSAAVSGASVTVFNRTTPGTNNSNYMSATTNSSGQYIIDLADMPSGYSNGDKLIISASYSGCSVESLHTIDTAAGSHTANMTLMSGTSGSGDSNYYGVLHSVVFSHSAAATIAFYEKNTGVEKLVLRLGSSGTTSVYLGPEGIHFNGGIVRVPSAAGVKCSMVIS